MLIIGRIFSILCNGIPLLNVRTQHTNTHAYYRLLRIGVIEYPHCVELGLHTRRGGRYHGHENTEMEIKKLITQDLYDI